MDDLHIKKNGYEAHMGFIQVKLGQ